ncbi:MAG: hypothetical protein R3293_06855 [Candidatus Promineifilaceae bacterium]|nr:hypothetical protein [Candidatus Promineifilaceae bacterium]
MLPLESNTYIFIIKIWREAATDDAKGSLWRGRVTYIPGGERNHFNNMDELMAIMKTRLQKIGIDN